MKLYIHIPFCKQKCRYCDFASFSGMESGMEAYIDDLLLECDQQPETLRAREITSVYIGGGTPSILPADLFHRLMEGLNERFHILPDCEWTCEANPGTLTEEWLDAACSGGVNRLSMGMQAKQSSLLNMLGRIHQYEDVQHSVSLARLHGIHNISLDLMFGLPGQTPAMWEETLHAAVDLNPCHISCYGLIPEDGTPLKHDLETGILVLPDENIEREMYDTAIHFLHEAGLNQYEISNFARPGYACRHNIGYWRQVYYLGLGVSASSMLPCPDAAYVRKTNPSTIKEYEAVLSGISRPDVQIISKDEAMFETLMLGLRMNDGVHEDAFQAMHGISLEEYRGTVLQKQIRAGLMVHEEGAYRLTRRGMDIQNSILVELMDP